MKNLKNIYLSLDEAREELRKRWNNLDLKKKIEEELGDRLISKYTDIPRIVLTRQLISPDNGCLFFCQCAKYINAKPLAQEFLGDIMVHFNEEKKGLGRLRITLKDGKTAIIDILDLHANDKKNLIDCSLRNGDNLVDFHHNLFNNFNYDIEKFDNTFWYRSFGQAPDYYYYMLLHFVAHGVLFETFFDEGDNSESSFTKEVVYPAIEKIYIKFGIRPMIIKSYPSNQDEAEDFYWWAYPKNINDFILDYAEKFDFAIKRIS